jgi:hypothetical protein
LNPDDLDIVETFTKYRSAINPNQPNYWTVDRARAEIAATAVSILFKATESPRVSCELFFIRMISPFTIDLCNTSAIVTRESASRNALKYPVGSSFYDTTCEDLHLSAQQGSQVLISAASFPTTATKSTVIQALDAMIILNVGREKIVPQIVQELTKPVSPYAD